MAWNIVYAGGGGSYYIDFTALEAQDPLSAGGVFSNNTQGVGGNEAPLEATSIRIVTRTGGGGVIACGSAAAQINYEDSFAFVPGIWDGVSNMRATATIWVAAGYNPNGETDNHELELIFGCRTGNAGGPTGNRYHRWIECLWAINSNQQVLSQDGPFPGANFTDISVFANDVGAMQNVDKMVGEIYPAANRVRWGRLRGGVTTWAQDVTNATYINGTLGSGIGIAAFRRFTSESAAASLGFTDLLIEAF